MNKVYMISFSPMSLNNNYVSISSKINADYVTTVYDIINNKIMLSENGMLYLGTYNENNQLYYKLFDIGNNIKIYNNTFKFVKNISNNV